MANPILKKTSFGLLRTNPKLTTNIKIVSDSKNKIFLESFDASPELNKSIYKGFEVNPNGFYSTDLRRFYDQNQQILPEDIAYTVFREDDTLDIKTQYNQQYDFTYSYGLTTKDSKYYSEEYSIFAPIWLEKENIPEYFVIFKMDGPSTVNINDKDVINLVGASANFDTNTILDQLVIDPSKFNDNFIKKSRIIKTFDLSRKSAIGKYIRNHIEDSLFPESPLFISLDKENVSYWNGISYKNGGFCSIGGLLYNEYTLKDKTLIESDDYITDGFRRNSVVCANILNLEFLFDDNEQIKYEFSRYYGLYMSEVEIGKFIIDKNRLAEDKIYEPTQIPAPVTNEIGDPFNDSSDIQTNKNGIKIYPKIGPSGPISGRLLTWEEVQNPRFSYVKDTKGNFYSIENRYNWKTIRNVNNSNVIDSDYIRIKNKGIDWKNFSGMNIPFLNIPVKSTESKGRSSFSFKVLNNPGNNDEIRIKYTDWNNQEEKDFIDKFTLKVDQLLKSGTANQRYFSNSGSLNDIAKSISIAINNLSDFGNDYQIFTALSINNEVIVYTRTFSENWNELKFSIFSDEIVFPYDVTSDEFSITKINKITNYRYSPINTITSDDGWYYLSTFTGGNTNPKSRLIIEKKYIQEFDNSKEDVYVKTSKGYKRIKQSLYLEDYQEFKGNITNFHNTDLYTIIEIEDNIGEFTISYDNTIALYNLAKNANGYFSIFPIRDFDYDFHSSEYNRKVDSDPEKLYKWYTGIGTTFGSPLFTWNSLNESSKKFINTTIGPSSSFNSNKSFQYVIGYQNPITDEIEETYNEYDRLKENSINSLSVASRVIPFINKWVYDNEGFDVRENPYRLNTNIAFGYSNFSPEFNQRIRNPKFFTHEWYYLQKYPPYMTFEEKVNSYSYFDEDLNFIRLPKHPDPNQDKYLFGEGNELLNNDNLTVTNLLAGYTGGTGASANLYSVNEDYFVSYFTRESVGGTAIPRDFKYSTFGNGSFDIPADTMFRGIKVEIIDRFENSSINYNKKNLKYIYNNKYNGYKFSAILTYGPSNLNVTVVKNDKWKNVTLVIQTNLDDILTSYTFGGKNYKFIDRCHLYTLEDKLDISSGAFKYRDKIISGLVKDWKYQTNPIDKDHFRVYFTRDNSGTRPKLNTELKYNEFGYYNDLIATDGVYTYTFKNIFDVDSDNFKCREITGLGVSSIPNINSTLEVLRYSISSPWLGNVTGRIKPLQSNLKQISGGYDAYEDILESISFSSIASDINNGDPDIEYVTITEDGKIEYDTFVINLQYPDYPLCSKYLKRYEIKNPNLAKNKIISYQLGIEDRVTILPLARYRGNYSPKFRDVFKFIDTEDIKYQNLSYYNIQLLTDLGYIKDSNLGMIKNFYYTKINPEGQKIIKSNSNESLQIYDVYAEIQEINIDKKDYFIFRSNWDPHYYNKYNDKDKPESVIGTREPKEEKSFFASKTLSIPSTIDIQTFAGIGTITELNASGNIEKLNNSLSNISKTLITEYVNLGGSIQLNISVFTEIQILKWFLDDGINKTFIDFMSNQYSFGTSSSQDDVIEYIKKNIHKRYEIKEIQLWEKKINLTKGESPSTQITTNLLDADKFNQGFIKTKNFRIIKNSEIDLNFKLIYNLPTQVKTSIAITIILQKK